MKKKPLAQNAALVSVLASILSIVIGLLIGFVVLLLVNPGAAAEGMAAMLGTGFSSLDKFGKVLYQTAPLLLCGLSVGFAFSSRMISIYSSSAC